MSERRNPFVLGKPIKEPRDFFGRELELRELFESVVHMQPVALLGEHRCGNTSILYQLLNPEVRAGYLTPADEEELRFVFVNAQLAAEGPEAFHRRLAKALVRVDEDGEPEPAQPVDNFWIEDYLESMADRGLRPVLLVDEFEVLADFEASFWEWFRGLIIEYDVSIVVATRIELGDIRDEWGSGSPFFNMFRSLYVGSFAPSEVDAFLATMSERSDLALTELKDAIEGLAGRFPYFVQVVGALFFERSRREPLTGSPEQVAKVAAEFRARTEAHFEDIWLKLPEGERQALAWLAVGGRPESREALVFNQALPSLRRRGYVVEERIFSSVFADYVRRQLPRIDLNQETGELHIEKRAVELPPKEFALLRFLFENEGEVVTKEDIAAAVWPEYSLDALGVTDAMIQKTISRLRKEVDVPDGSYQHIESVRGQGYRFQNASVYEVYHHRADGDDRR